MILQSITIGIAEIAICTPSPFVDAYLLFTMFLTRIREYSLSIDSTYSNQKTRNILYIDISSDENVCDGIQRNQ